MNLPSNAPSMTSQKAEEWPHPFEHQLNAGNLDYSVDASLECDHGG